MQASRSPFSRPRRDAELNAAFNGRSAIGYTATRIDRGNARGVSMAFDLTVNGTSYSVDADPETPLLWVIRDYLGLTGTKFSCGIAQCGACTVHVDGQPVRSCSFPASL